MDLVGNSLAGQEGIYAREIWARLWRRRAWVCTSTCLVTIVCTAVAFLLTPIYRATTILVPAGADRRSLGGNLTSSLGQLGNLASLAGLGVGSTDIETEEALAVLRSRQFTENFILSRNLLPRLYASKWNSKISTWKANGENIPTAAMAYRYFDKDIRQITQNSKTGMVTLEINWKDRVEAANWTNDIVQMLNLEMRSRALEKTRVFIGFLNLELTKTSDIGTREAINRLIEAQIKTKMLASVVQEYAFRVVDLALPPEAKDPVRPLKTVLVLLGVVLGLTSGCMIVLIADAFERPKNSR